MKKTLITVLSILTFILGKAQSPTFQWAKPLNGTTYADGNGVAVDKYGNVYSTGNMNGTVDMDPGPGVFLLTNPNNNSGFYVLKLDAQGSFVWATFFPNGFCWDIALDTASNPHVTGNFNGTIDFDPGPGTFTLTTATPSTTAGQDIFVLKLSAQGNFMWAKQLGQSNAFGNQDVGYGIAVDRLGNVHVGGTISDDISITKLDPAGNLVWSRQLGGIYSEGAWALALDTLGNVITTGHFMYTMDFDPGPAIYTLTIVGGSDTFVLKLDPSGNFVWAVALGSGSSDDGRAIATDAIGNVIVAGILGGPTDFDPGPGTYTLTKVGNFDFYILKLSPSGSFVWAKAVGSFAASVAARDIKTAGDNDIYITGPLFGVADLNPSPANTYTVASIGNSDVFILKLNGSGIFDWAISVGGDLSDYPSSIDVSQTGAIYVTGSYEVTSDFDPGPPIYNLTATGTDDVFVLKLLECLVSQVPTLSGSGPVCAGTSATLSVSGAVTYTWNTGVNTTSIVITPTATTVYTVQGTNQDACVNSATITQVVSLCTGIENTVFGLSQPNIYPNPNNGNFSVKGIQSSALYDYELIDANGQTIERGNKEVKNESALFSFSEKGYFPGLYILRLSSSNDQALVKFIIQ